jgi:hypothetical protein
MKKYASIFNVVDFEGNTPQNLTLALKFQSKLILIAITGHSTGPGDKTTVTILPSAYFLSILADNTVY